MNSKNLQNKREENEVLTADEKKISEFIGSLEKVSAPNDFDFRLKARISAHGQENYQSGYWQWLRYLLPVGASAFVLAFVLYGTNFFAPATSFEQAKPVESAKSEELAKQPTETYNAVAADSNSAKAEDFPPNSSVQNNLLPTAKEQKTVLIADKSGSKKIETRAKTTPEDNFKGSRDLGREPVSVQILPSGIEPNKSVPQTEDVENFVKTNIVGMLNFIGVEIVSEDGKMKVKSVKQDTLAERLGVKTGDIIESFDEQKTDGGSNSSNLGGARKLVVSRDGKLKSFDLKLD